MQFEKLTIKAQEAVASAKRLADQMRHSEVDVEHLLLALAEQEDGVVPLLLERVGVSPESFRQTLRQTLASRPTVEGAAERYFST